MSAPQKTEQKRTVKEPNEKTEKYTAHFKIVSINEIPKATRTRTGEYAEITNKLKSLKEGDALTFDVPKRTTANGIQKYFKPLGYVVTTRRNKDVDDGSITVFISKSAVK